MEVFNLPLRVLVSMWLIQRIKRPRGVAMVNVNQHLTGQIENINNVMRIERPLREIHWFELWLRGIVSRHRSALIKERDKLGDAGVYVVGFIPKGDDNERGGSNT